MDHMNRRQLLRVFALFAGNTLLSPVGRALSAGTASAIAAGEPAFGERRRAMVSTLTEMIIPRTDTPGAIDAGVSDYIESMVRTWYTPTERGIFYEGLDALDIWCKKLGGQDFVHSDDVIRTQALSEAEQQALAYSAIHRPGQYPQTVEENTPFFAKLKDFTGVGFFTSESGATQALSYNPIPGRFEGSYDLASAVRGWASGSCVNPTLTFMALAARAADYTATQLGAGQI